MSPSMSFWRIINRSHLKYASNQLTRNYTRLSIASSLTNAVKQTKLSSFDIQNLDIFTRPSNILGNFRFLASSAQTRKKEEKVDSNAPRLNEKITAEYVRLVSEDGHSVVSLKEALRRAKELESDLVEVQREATPPVCKIVKYSLEKYKKAKVGKERAKAKRAEAIKPEVKEIRFTPKIEAKDLKFKSDQALKLMESGYRVKCCAVPDKDKHKELEPEKLLELLSRFTCYLEDALVEFGPEADRKTAVVIVRHAKFGPPKKGGVRKLKDLNIQTAAIIKVDSSKLDSSETEGFTLDDEEDTEKPESGLSARQVQSESSSESSRGRDANRFQQPTTRFEPQFPNQVPSASGPKFLNQQSSGRIDHQSPIPPRPRFPDQAPHQQPSRPPPPNRHLDRQAYPPRFQNQTPNQQSPDRFEPQPPNPTRTPPRRQTRLPNEIPNKQPTGPSSGYGIFSTPKTK